MSEWHDNKTGILEGPSGSAGRSVVAAIGIDRYQHWPALGNAVRDATSTAALFRRLGFEQVTEPLLDDHATGRALQSLVTDELMTLSQDDSLVLVYAGHGGNRKHRIGDRMVKTGYLIPVDASADKVASWVDLEGWLRAVSLLPPRHILVILDACYSGVALDPIIKWRDIDSWQDEPMPVLHSRRSRRIITSALDDQVACDSGPVPGHSLFTGCLLEGLTHGIRRNGELVTTGSQLGIYVQRRVQAYPDSQQTPDFGTFAFDDRGEILIPLVTERTSTTDTTEPGAAPARPAGPTTPVFAVVDPAPTPKSAPEPALAPREPSRNHRRWLSAVVAGACALAVAVFGYRMFLTSPSQVEPGPRITAQGPLDASIDTDHFRAIDRPADAAEFDAIGTITAPHPFDAAGLDAARRVAMVSPSDARNSSETSPASKSSLRACPRGMLAIAAGTFHMGSSRHVGNNNEIPEHEVTLSGYCIDRTEVTVKAYAACVAAGGCTAPLLTVSEDYEFRNQLKQYDPRHNQLCNSDSRPNHPINCIDWNEAAAYCTWAGKRLPTEAEWEYAARGSDGRRYPWGNEPPNETRLNACGVECAEMMERVIDKGYSIMFDASDHWEATAPVGSFPRGVSPFGVLDMAGNVWEWTADWEGDYSADPAMNPLGPQTGTVRATRGGGWLDFFERLVAASARWGRAPSFRGHTLGFRCASER